MTDDHDDLLDELRDLAQEHGGQDYDLDAAQQQLEERFAGEAKDEAGAVSSYRPDPPASQPCNQATMVCLRGPCMYLWSMTTRYGADDGKTVHIQRHRVCVRHAYETQLADQNVYQCEAWKPAPLAWLPDSIWATVRRLARDGYEHWLRLRGYNFDWRHWQLDTFEWDDKERRRFSGPGGGHLYDQATAAKQTKSGFGATTPRED